MFQNFFRWFVSDFTSEMWPKTQQHENDKTQTTITFLAGPQVFWLVHIMAQWKPWSLAEILVVLILHHLEGTHLHHPTQSQEDDCYQHDYAFIRLAMHCLQTCGFTHARFERVLLSEKPVGGWSDQLDSCWNHFPLLLHKCVTVGGHHKERGSEKWFHSDFLHFLLQW